MCETDLYPRSFQQIGMMSRSYRDEFSTAEREVPQQDPGKKCSDMSRATQCATDSREDTKGSIIPVLRRPQWSGHGRMHGPQVSVWPGKLLAPSSW